MDYKSVIAFHMTQDDIKTDQQLRKGYKYTGRDAPKLNQ